MSKPTAAALFPRLIVAADDFGASSSVNRAVIECHRRGVLTSASLLAGGAAFEEAVSLARDYPNLGVGLHLALTHGKSVCPHDQIPDLTDSERRLSGRAILSGFRFFFRRHLAGQLEREITAQFERFQSTGLKLDHVNGHLNIHLHPVVLRLVLKIGPGYGMKHLRLTRDPLWTNLRLAKGRWVYRLSHAVVFAALAARARPQLTRRNIGHTRRVFGLLQSGNIHAPYLLGLLSKLDQGSYEIYTHPDLAPGNPDFKALTDLQVRSAIQKRGIQLIRCQDWPCEPGG